MTVTPDEPASKLDSATLAEIARVRASGVLGASGRLLELFDFLALRSAEGQPPKEAEIALAVFGKAGPDSMRDDPVARVYIHRLRKRLDDFYLRHGMPDGVRLDIPKGDYRIACLGVDGAEAGVAGEQIDAEAINHVAPPAPDQLGPDRGRPGRAGDRRECRRLDHAGQPARNWRAKSRLPRRACGPKWPRASGRC